MCPSPPPAGDVICPAYDPAKLPASAAPSPAANAGTIAGAFSVSPLGEAVYTLPLTVPPGRAGMEPKLTLRYASSGGDGLFGMGFQLTGLSAVTRCPKNIAQDGQIRGVKYDAEDALCLDGLRLVQVGAYDDADGHHLEYRTFPDTFQRIVADYPPGWDAANGPSMLTAFTKAGRILGYGSALNARVMGKNGQIRAWWVAWERDRRGNEITTSYRNDIDPHDGHTLAHAPLQIAYTSHGATQPMRAVDFHVLNSPHHSVAFTGGMQVNRGLKIDKIRMLGPGRSVVRSYRLTYDWNPITMRPRLSRIRECAEDDDAQCKPATELRWQTQPGRGFTAKDTSIPYRVNEADPQSSWAMVDVTGDGLDDMLLTRTTPPAPGLLPGTDWLVAKNTGGALAAPVTWQTTFATSVYSALLAGLYEPIPNDGPWYRWKTFPLDVDHDGRNDTLYYDPNGGEVRWLKAAPEHPTVVDMGTGIVNQGPIDFPLARSTTLFGDVDGDGKADMIQCEEQPKGAESYPPGRWQLRRWDPTALGFGAPAPLAALGTRGCYVADYIHVLDWDADGKAELLVPAYGYFANEHPPKQPSPCGSQCTLQALAWEASRWTTRETHLPAGPVVFGDFNGDGLPDAMEPYNADSSLHQLWTYLNTGDGFDPVGLPSLGATPDEQTFYFSYAVPGDFNGDGHMDVLLPMLHQSCPDQADVCWVNLQSDFKGSGHFTLHPTTIPASYEFASYDPPASASVLRPQITDLNGDGRHDVIVPLFDRYWAFVSEGPQDLLVSVTDGMTPLDPGNATKPPDPGFLPTVAITYGNLLDHASTEGIAADTPAAEDETYLPRADEENDCAYPRSCVVSAARVVAAYQLNNGQNQARSFSVRYRDGRFHHLGRGFLGFGSRIVTDRDTGAGAIERFDNVTYDPVFRAFPYAGQEVHRQGFVPGLPPGQAGLPRIALSYVDRLLQTRSTNAGQTYFTLPVLTRTRAQEDIYPPIGETVTLLRYVAAHASATMGTLRDSLDIVSDYDSYGNVVAEVHTTKGVDDTRTVTRVVVNDALAPNQPGNAKWLLGQVKLETECSASASLALTQCRETSRIYNDHGEVDIEKHRDPAYPDSQLTVTYTRDAFGNPTRVTADDSLGHHRSSCVSYEPEAIFPYAIGNAAGHISYVGFDPNLGVKTAAIDPNGLASRWQYDSFGRLQREIRPDGSTTTTTLQRTKDGGPSQQWWQFTTRTVVSGGGASATELDSLGRPVRTWTVGPAVSACSDGTCASDPLYEEDIGYDLLGRVAQRSLPFLYSSATAAVRRYHQYAYDALGRVTAHTTPWNVTATYDDEQNTTVAIMAGASSITEHDPLGRAVLVTDAKGGETRYTYGPFGALWKVTGPDRLDTVTERDAYGRVRRQIDPDRGTTTFAYDGFGQQVESKDALGRSSHFTYDPLGRLIEQDDPDGTTCREYDSAPHGIGKPWRVSVEGGAVKTYSFDPLGRLSTTELAIGSDTFVTTLAYDWRGRLETINYPGGPGQVFRLRRELDDNGYLLAVRDDVTGALYWQLDQVNGTGQPTRETFGNRTATERTYDPAHGRVTHILTSNIEGPLQDLSYGYDGRLNLVRRTDGLQRTGPAGKPMEERFSYDTLDRLTCTSFTHPGCSAGDCPCDVTITYHPNGNIDTKSDVGAYVYDPDHPHAVQRVVGTTLSYEVNALGNQVVRPEATIDYTSFDLPKTYTLAKDGAQIAFDYDGDHARVRKTSPLEETVYVGDLYERVTHKDTQVVEHRYAVHNGERVVAVVTQTKQDPAGSAVYLHPDHLGSTDVVTDGATSGPLERRSYDAFGVRRNEAWGQKPPASFSVMATDVGFTGHQGDDEVGLVNMKGRMQDPRLGRFLTPDPIVAEPSFSQSWNPYAYVLNNPLTLTDPSGFAPDDGTGGEAELPAVTGVEVSGEEGARQLITTWSDGARMKATCLEDGQVRITEFQAPELVILAQAADAALPVASTGSLFADPRLRVIAEGWGGLFVGLGLGLTPGGGVADLALTTTGVIGPGTKPARLGKALGEMLGGFFLTASGVTGEVVGTGLTTTGLGSLIGVPTMVVSAGLVTSGTGNMAAGLAGFAQALMSSGSGGEAPAAGGGGRVNKVGPDPEATGPHTTFKRDPNTGRVTGYTEWDASGNPVKRFRGEGGPHGGQDPPLILEPKSGKGPGSPPKVPRPPNQDELPPGY